MPRGPYVKSTFRTGPLDWVTAEERMDTIRWGTERGMSARELATQLGTTIRTVERYRRQIRESK